MTVYNCLLIDIEPKNDGLFLCTFCKKRDKFNMLIPESYVFALSIGEYFNVKFDMMTNNINGMVGLSFKYIDFSKKQ